MGELLAALSFVYMLATAPVLIWYWPKPESCPDWLAISYGSAFLIFFIYALFEEQA